MSGGFAEEENKVSITNTKGQVYSLDIRTGVRVSFLKGVSNSRFAYFVFLLGFNCIDSFDGELITSAMDGVIVKLRVAN